jgi:cytochrome-b5 reductase
VLDFTLASWSISLYDGSTPLYQVVTHALSDRTNKTKFKLIFANVTEQDILLREEFDALKKKYPQNFDVVYVLGKPEKDWTGEFLKVLYGTLANEKNPGPIGFITSDLIKEHIAPASLKDKVKVFVCGKLILFSAST